MSSRAQHYRQAERLLGEIAKNDRQYADTKDMMADEANMLATAQAHATLATVHDDAYNEYLDLKSVEMLREEVVATPPPDSRDWLIDEDTT